MVKIWQKYINKLSNKEKIIFRDIIQKLLLKDFKTLDIKRIIWKENEFRVRIWNKRIIFSIENQKVIILKIWPRGDIYK